VPRYREAHHPVGRLVEVAKPVAEKGGLAGHAGQEGVEGPLETGAAAGGVVERADQIPGQATGRVAPAVDATSRTPEAPKPSTSLAGRDSGRGRPGRGPGFEGGPYVCGALATRFTISQATGPGCRRHFPGGHPDPIELLGYRQRWPFRS
jgi:hypothetical protein